jgi:hypothetical protein
MKKILLIMVMMSIGTGLTFAQSVEAVENAEEAEVAYEPEHDITSIDFSLDDDAEKTATASFEFDIGGYGGFGTAGAAGLGIQIGVAFPLADDAFELAILGDLGIGFRYGGMEAGNTEGTDYLLGLLAEFYFKPFMGIGIGGGLIPCICTLAQEDMIEASTIYARLVIPFKFKYVKFGAGFDYIFMPDNEYHTTAEADVAFRVNFFANFRVMDLFR